MKKQILKVEDVTLDMVKVSDFGCPNCLHSCIECRNYDKFKPSVTRDGYEPTCKAYSYYD